jgi:zinc transport system ATP-binding protein
LTEAAATPETGEAGARGAGREVLRCDGLVIGYAGQGLLPPIDLSVRRGEVLLVTGCNGSGKSTWLRTVLGLVPPVRGHVRLGSPPPRIAYVPQTPDLDELVPLRAGEVVDWGRLRGWSFLRPWRRRADHQARDRAMAEVGAADLARRPFRELSGGQRQRVLFARVLASEADLVLLDEPTASMDVASERDVHALLARMARERDMAVVIVTHTLHVAARYADRVVFFEPGEDDGVVVAGAAEQVFADAHFQRHFGEVSPDHGH